MNNLKNNEREQILALINKWRESSITGSVFWQSYIICRKDCADELEAILFLEKEND